MSNTDVQSWVQQFLDGWNAYHTQVLKVIIGMNNYHMDTLLGTSGAAADGKVWCDMISNLRGGKTP